VVTVQTAVRCLGEKYEKYDEEDGDNGADSLSEGNKLKLLELLNTAPVMFCDEVQHWAAKTCQSVSNACMEARFRFGVSATPWRDQNDDLLIDGCFGRALADIRASDLIEKGVLVKPTIYFICTSSRISGTYAHIYKECVVENDARNSVIAETATKLRGEGRRVLVLVKQIAHGEKLESIIPNSKFISGQDSGNLSAARIRATSADRFLTVSGVETTQSASQRAFLMKVSTSDLLTHSFLRAAARARRELCSVLEG
jgi:superfamily II DNA or RNA helicase